MNDPAELDAGHQGKDAECDSKDGGKTANPAGEKGAKISEIRGKTIEAHAVVRRANTTTENGTKHKTEKKKKRKSMMSLPGRHYGFRRKESKISQADAATDSLIPVGEAVVPSSSPTNIEEASCTSVTAGDDAVVPTQDDIASFPTESSLESEPTPEITVSEPQNEHDGVKDKEGGQYEPIYDVVPSIMPAMTETPTALFGADDDVDVLFAAWCELRGIPVVEDRARRSGLAWLPHGLEDNDIAEFMSQMDAEEVPRLGSIGARRRQLSLLRQVPLSDLTPKRCHHLSPDDQPLYREFVQARDSLALDAGCVTRLTTSAACHACHSPISAGQFVVTAALLPSAVWHPSCFTCQCCSEPLADFLYCQLRGKLVCVRDYGQHHHDRCARCSELIFSGEYVRAQELTWHRDCFRCQRCNASLADAQFGLKNSEIFCLKCFADAVASACFSCQKPIFLDEKEMGYGGKHWHAACFQCSTCQDSLEGKTFGLRKDRLLCAKCAVAPVSPTVLKPCIGCGQEIRKGTRYMESQLGQWHEACFVCCTCHEPLESRTFLPKEDRLYCSRCYEETFAARCNSCHGTITSVGVTYQGDTWHRQCFCCTNCGTGLAGLKFKSHDKHPYCGDCHRELFGRRCARCHKPMPTERGAKYSAFANRCWHNECFSCFECGTSLVGKGFMDMDGDVICPECGRQRLDRQPPLQESPPPEPPSQPPPPPPTEA